MQVTETALYSGLSLASIPTTSSAARNSYVSPVFSRTYLYRHFTCEKRRRRTGRLGRGRSGRRGTKGTRVMRNKGSVNIMKSPGPS